MEGKYCVRCGKNKPTNYCKRYKIELTEEPRKKIKNANNILWGSLICLALPYMNLFIAPLVLESVIHTLEEYECGKFEEKGLNKVKAGLWLSILSLIITAVFFTIKHFKPFWGLL